MTVHTTFPAHGESWPEIERELIARRALDPDPILGAPDAYWPTIPDAAFHAAREAWLTYSHLNAFSTPLAPGFAAIDMELRSAIGDLFAAQADNVTITAGGTEGNFLAVKSAREWARTHRPTRTPVIVLPRTAHPSFDKAAHELGVGVRRVDVRADWTADPVTLEAALDQDAIMVVGSMPSYPHGAVDDIPAIARLAAGAGIWMHVDAAVGGFIAPHLQRLDPSLPRFTCDVTGVRSITADLHKLGFCLNGISTFTVADPADRAWARFSADVWPRGPYTRQGFLGSRPAAIVAAAWAVIRTLGREGYLEIARTIHERDAAIASRVAAMDGFRVVTPARMGLTAIEPTDRDVNAVVGRLAEDAGIALAVNAEPPSIQLFSTPALDVDLVLDALAAARRVTPTTAVGATSADYGAHS